MGIFFSISRAGNKELKARISGKEELAATQAFLSELNPSVLSQMFGMRLNYNPFALISDKVDLYSAFNSEVFPTELEANRKLKALKLDKPGHEIGVKHYAQLKKVIGERALDGRPVFKAYVTSPHIRDKKGKLININPDHKRGANSIAVHKFDNPAEAVDKIAEAIKDFSPADQVKFLKRFDFSKAKLTPEALAKLDKIGGPLHVDPFHELKVKPENIATKKISTPHLAVLMESAVNNRKPLDLKGLDISKCDLIKALDMADKRLAKSSKTVNRMILNTAEFEGSKMSHFQQQILDKVLDGRTPVQPPIDPSRTAVKGNVSKVMPEKVDSMFVDMMNKIGTTFGMSSDLAKTRETKIAEAASRLR